MGGGGEIQPSKHPEAIFVVKYLRMEAEIGNPPSSLGQQSTSVLLLMVVISTCLPHVPSISTPLDQLYLTPILHLTSSFLHLFSITSRLRLSSHPNLHSWHQASSSLLRMFFIPYPLFFLSSCGPPISVKQLHVYLK